MFFSPFLISTRSHVFHAWLLAASVRDDRDVISTCAALDDRNLYSAKCNQNVHHYYASMCIDLNVQTFHKASFELKTELSFVQADVWFGIRRKRRQDVWSTVVEARNCNDNDYKLRSFHCLVFSSKFWEETARSGGGSIGSIEPPPSAASSRCIHVTVVVLAVKNIQRNLQQNESFQVKKSQNFLGRGRLCPLSGPSHSGHPLPTPYRSPRSNPSQECLATGYGNSCFQNTSLFVSIER